MAGKMAVEGAVPLQFNGYKIPLMRNLVKRAIRGTVQRRRLPWDSFSGRRVRGAIGSDPHCVGPDLDRGDRGLSFMIVHALYLISWAEEAICKRRKARRSGGDSRAGAAALAGGAAVSLDHGGVDVRAADHGVSAQGGVQFNWVSITGSRAGADGVDPVSHRSRVVLSGFLVDLAGQDRPRDAMNRERCGFSASRRRRQPVCQVSAGEQAVSLVIVLAGLAVIVTGLFMMKRVQTGIFTRNPYLFSDMTWGMMYVLHGLAGVGLIALVMIHMSIWGAAGEAAHYEVDDLWMDEPRFLS
jgi:uncharacterized protein YneF (UPF0154 family)